MSEGIFSALTRFYRCRLRHMRLFRVPKEAVWTVVWFTRWKILQPVTRAFLTVVSFIRWQILRPAARAVLTAVWFTRWKIVRPAVRAVIPRAAFPYLNMLRSGGPHAIWRCWREPTVPLLSLTAAATSQAGSIEILSAPERVSTPPPGLYPAAAGPILPLALDAYEFPAVVVAQVFDAEVSGRSNLVLSHGAVVHHDLYRFSHDFTSEELHGRIRIFPRKNTVKRFLVPEVRHKLAVGALFTDSCAHNYAHWLSEVLPRINLFCRRKPDTAIPLIVDAGLHTNLEASLHAVAGEDATVIRLGVDDAAHVNRLLVTSPTGYIPFERRRSAESGHSHGVFSPHALSSMRERLADVLPPPAAALPTRVILRRSSVSRLMRNEQQLEEKLVSRGFSVIQPELLSFAEQFHLFTHAEVIVGATGAGLANLLFCPKSTRVIICISTHPEHSYGYWQNMACAVGNKVDYVLGPTVGPAAQGVHADFCVDIDDVIRAIEQ